MKPVSAGSIRSLRWRLIGLMGLLLVPTAVLVSEAWRQVRWEGLHQQQALAREFVASINRSLERLRRSEATIEFEEYAFATTPVNASANVIQRSRLSDYPVEDVLPGIVGRFQVAGDGALSTPLLPTGNPAEYGVSADEYQARQQAEARVLEVLQAEPVALRDAPSQSFDADVLAQAPPGRASRAEAKAEAAERRDQGLFDRLTARSAPASSPPALRQRSPEPAQVAAKERLGKSALESDESFAAATAEEAVEVPARAARSDRAADATGGRADDAAPVPATALIEQEAVPDGELEADAERVALPKAPAEMSDARLLAIDAALDSLSFQLLDGGYFLLFRRQFRGGERYLQGAALERDRFLERIVAEPFRASSVAAAARLEVGWGDTTLARYQADAGARRYDSAPAPLDGEVLHQERLLSPFDGLQLRFLTTSAPVGPGGPVVLWSAAVLVLLMIVGFHFLYRAGARQLALARQQQDFVSAVSHELRTPLTSIRMYSEMLRAGWADEAKKRAYYDLIHDESERLSRLVANVLQLSRMSRTGLALEPVLVDVATLLGRVVPALEQVAGAGGFTLRVEPEKGAAAARLEVDLDAFLQVLLNLVDNAIKFAAAGERREIVLTVGADPAQVRISVRDYGPGLPPGDPDRLFELFHRPGDATAPGTGIGLALVRGLVEEMGGTVRARNAEPGALFRISIPRKESGP